MFKNIMKVVFCASCCFAVHPLLAQSLPETLGDWTLTETKIYAGPALYDYINGGAEMYFEYGFSTVEVGYYYKNELEILAEVYTMSSPQAAMGIYSFFRNHTAPPLPKPYTGALYDFHLECLNGTQYIKIINYDSLRVDERVALLEELVPKPRHVSQWLPSNIFPKNRISDSEVFFNGPISLRNFAPLGRINFFGVGEKTTAHGCLIELDGKQYKWVVVEGDPAKLSEDLERFFAFQKRNDYEIQDQSRCTLLKDQLTGNHMVLIHRGNRIHFLFGFRDEEKEKIIDYIKSNE
jgi:hypothetical protein